VVAAILAVLCVFQFLLVAGAPFGQAAFGGAHTTLPTTLRMASLITILIYALGGCVVLRRSGFRVAWIPMTVARPGTLAATVILGLSALTNFASQSAWERFLNAPISLVLAFLCFIVARSPVADDSAQSPQLG
jgi:hypothetical protein